MAKSISTKVPEEFHRDPDGSTVFRWGVEGGLDAEGAAIFVANEARVYKTPTLENVEIGAIESYCPLSEQVKLLHDNNISATEKGVPTAKYTSFLAERTKIKDAVKAYFDKVKVVR